MTTLPELHTSRLDRNLNLHTITEEEERSSSRHVQHQPQRPLRTYTSSALFPSSITSQSPMHKNREWQSPSEIFEFSGDDESEIDTSIMSDTSSAISFALRDSSDMHGKHRTFPTLAIPSPSLWPAVPRAQTKLPPRPPKVPLSPAVLSMLGNELLRPSNPPSLADSLFTDSPSAQSGPVTPETQQHSQCGDLWTQTCQSHPIAAVQELDGEAIKPQRPIISITTQASSKWSKAISGVVTARPRALPESPILGVEAEHQATGIELPDNALDVLHWLTGKNHDSLAYDELEDDPHLIGAISPTESPVSRITKHGISRLVVPSPSVFFDSLGQNARKTWHCDSSPLSALLPTSTTAEQFYKCPWNTEAHNVVEHVVEIPFDASVSDDQTTARQASFPSGKSTKIVSGIELPKASEPSSPLQDEYDENYAQAIQDAADKTLDRTTSWLSQQSGYLAILREGNPVNQICFRDNCHLQNVAESEDRHVVDNPIRKVVRFNDQVAEQATDQPRTHELTPHSSSSTIFFEAFCHMKSTVQTLDSFEHRFTRADSIQSARLCLPREHRSWLQGDLSISTVKRPAPPRPISMMPGRINESPVLATTEAKLFARIDQERQALDQIKSRAWVLEAIRFLTGGSLLNSPAQEALARSHTLASTPPSVPAVRVLDLGEPGTGDWAWHCASEYPHAQIHTAASNSDAPSDIPGPPNHQLHQVPQLWDLPFPTNHFDAISARSLPSHLKINKIDSNSKDQYDLCLDECFRCLKPGGYLEFTVLDSEILNAGPRASVVSVAFGMNLTRMGFAAQPTKIWLGKVKKAGFDDIKRAWTFLPIGWPTERRVEFPAAPPPEIEAPHVDTGPGSGVDTTISSKPVAPADEFRGKVEAVRGPLGSTANIAAISGLVGAWAWERWMLKVHGEMGKQNALEGVAAALEEGKHTGAGWRCLRGWARKPTDVQT